MHQSRAHVHKDYKRKKKHMLKLQCMYRKQKDGEAVTREKFCCLSCARTESLRFIGFGGLGFLAASGGSPGASGGGAASAILVYSSLAWLNKSFH